MSERRVVVTGIGLVTPLALGAADFWSALIEGRSAVARVDLTGDGGEPRHLVARVPDFKIRSFVSDRKLLRLMCRTDRLGLAAARMAADDAGEVVPPLQRRSAFIAARKEMGPVEELFDAIRASRDASGDMTPGRMGSDGYGEIPPMTLVCGLPNGCLFAASVLHSIKGGGANFLGSGEVGLYAIGAAYRAIQRGEADWALAGAHDVGADRWTYADFHRLGLISEWAGEPEQAVKPFDRRRDGFAPGEGAGMVVLEDLESARARGARIWAEVLGFAETCDATGMVQPGRDGAALARAVTRALQQADLAPEDVDYVNAYGSATMAGDTVLALHHQVVPPTLNLARPEPECHFDLVPDRARPAALRAATTISRGIGGQNAVMALRRWSSR